MTTEEFKIDGEQLLAKVKELIHEGNIRRIIIKNETGATLYDRGNRGDPGACSGCGGSDCRIGYKMHHYR